ncbi:hypothetical protein ACEPPZ_14440 [Paracoccus yeei]|uniref:hypothetical protein n=1 Tax=Paracoccus yeei TaxID=147645 RepID=UPI0028D2ECFC|nr:hypothetical protein [Paracoccus yeei]
MSPRSATTPVTRIIRVDDTAQPLDGSSLVLTNRHAVEAGFMANLPVVLIYPSGRKVKAYEARLTPKGMAEIARQMGRQPGGAQ